MRSSKPGMRSLLTQVTVIPQMSRSKNHPFSSRTASGWLFSSFYQYSSSQLLKVWADGRWENWVLPLPHLKPVVICLPEVLKREDSFSPFFPPPLFSPVLPPWKPQVTELSINKQFLLIILIFISWRQDDEPRESWEEAGQEFLGLNILCMQSAT